MGSGLFLSAVVVGTIALMGSGQVELVGSSAARDISMYLLGLTVTMVILVTGRFYLWQGLALLLLYVGYIVVVLMMANETWILRWRRFTGWCRKLFPSRASTTLDAYSLQQHTINCSDEVIYPVIHIEDFDDVLGRSDDGLGSPKSTQSTVPSRPLSPVVSSQQQDFLQVPMNEPYSPRGRARIPDFRHRRANSEPSNQRRPASIRSTTGSVHSLSSEVEYPSLRRKRKKPLSLLYRAYTPQQRQSQPRAAIQRSLSAPHGEEATMPGEHLDVESAIRDDVSENIVQLHFHDTIMENLSGKSLPAAVELWSAWNVLNRSRTPSLRSPDTAIPDAHHEERSGAGIFGPSSNNAGSSRGRKSASPSVAQIPASSAPSSAPSVPLIETHDFCPACFKCSSTLWPDQQGPLFPVEESPKQSLAFWWKWNVVKTAGKHFFPLFYTWHLNGLVGKILAVITLLPSTLLSLTIPVVTTFESEDYVVGQTEVTIDSPPPAPATISVDPTTPTPVRRRSSSASRERQSATSAGRINSKPPTRRRSQSSDRRRAHRSNDSLPMATCRKGGIFKIPWRHRWITLVQVLVAPLFFVFATGSKSALQRGIHHHPFGSVHITNSDGTCGMAAGHRARRSFQHGSGTTHTRWLSNGPP